MNITQILDMIYSTSKIKHNIAREDLDDKKITLSDMNIDSLDLVEIVMELELEHGIIIDDACFDENISSLMQLAKFIEHESNSKV